jgi:hypothetical protein
MTGCESHDLLSMAPECGKRRNHSIQPLTGSPKEHCLGTLLCYLFTVQRRLNQVGVRKVSKAVSHYISEKLCGKGSSPVVSEGTQDHVDLGSQVNLISPCSFTLSPTRQGRGVTKRSL